MNTIITSIVTLNFLVFQTLLPYTVAYANEEQPQEETVVEEEPTDEETSEEEQTEEQPEEEPEEEQNPEVQEATTDEVQTEEENSDEQQPEPDVVINGENDAIVENDADSNSNTGENEVTTEEVAEEPDEACQLELDEYQKSLDQEVAEGEEQALFELSEECKKFLEEEEGTDPGQEITELQEETTPEQLEEVGEQVADDTAAVEEGVENTEEEEEETDEEEEEKADEEEELTEEQLAAQELERTARDLGDDATIDTGDATAIANIYNEINENIIGNNWVDTAFNIYGIYEGDINLLEIFESLFEILMNNGSQLFESMESIEIGSIGEPEEPTEEVDLEEEQETEECVDICDPLDVEINNTNNAQIENDGTAQANSGKNEISDVDGDATITTGDAFAMVNIVNVVNRNIVGENWLFVIINIFGDWTGNLIVPGADLLNLPSATQFADLTVNNNNNADVSNNVQSGANTGDNVAIENGGDSTILTGDAYSDANVTNVLNTNIVGSNWFSLSINNMGTWFGGINNWFGGDGALQYDFNADETILTAGSLTVNNTNNADVDNEAVSYANTGGNVANVNGGDASIVTGDAVADSNVMNFVNTNIIGSNWLYGMLNIMGTWNGNVEFAYPDLDISIDDGKTKAYSGDELEYEITVKNNGLADAENAQVVLDLSDEVSYASASKKTTVKSGSYVWDMSGLAVGESESFKVKARVVDPLEQDGAEAVATAQVETETAEKEKSNNTDSDKTVAHSNGWGDYHDAYSYEDDIDVQRVQTIAGPVRKGDVVNNSIIVKNDSDVPLYDVRLKELLVENGGGKIVEYEWRIGDMDVDDKILIDYSLLVNGFANLGDYTFTASAKGEDPFDDIVRSGKHDMPMKVIGGFAYDGFYEGDGEEDPFTLIPAAQAFGDDMVLGASDARTCNYIPIWIWLSALAAYGLAINWSLFPFRKGTETGNGRMVALPSLATVGILVFWWFFRCDLMLWFAAAVFVILFLHLIIKERQHKRQTFTPLKPA